MNIRLEKINFEQIKGFMDSASEKIGKAKKILSVDEQIAFQAAYDAMLRVSLAFMLSFGKRARNGVGHHKIIIDFVSKKLGSEYKNIIRTFDLMRRKRNEAIYEPISSISEKEAKESLVVASKYLQIISKEISRRHPQAKLF